MWIITHDSVHDESNPSKNVPRSRDYLERMTRKQAEKLIARIMEVNPNAQTV